MDKHEMMQSLTRAAYEKGGSGRRKCESNYSMYPNWV